MYHQKMIQKKVKYKFIYWKKIKISRENMDTQQPIKHYMTNFPHYIKSLLLIDLIELPVLGLLFMKCHSSIA